MKNHLPGYLAAAVLGIAAGWAIGASRRAPEAMAPPRPAAPVADAAPPPPAPLPPPEPAPAPSETPAPSPKAPEAAAKAAVPPPEWYAKIKSLPRVKDLLGLELPPGDAGLRQSCFYARNHQIRELLKNDAAQAAFLADLPAMSERELVALWDVFWLSDREKAGGFRQYGPAFARKLSQSLFELVPAQTDRGLRMMAASLLLPDTRYLNDREVEYLRNFFQASGDPFLKRKASDLPDRGTR
jgi:hypothetical protein